MNRQKLFFTTVFLIVLIVSLPLVSAYTLSYDANGNLVTGDEKYREYNGFNKLVRVRDGNNATGNLLEEYMWEADKDKVLVKHVYENNTWKESIYYPSQTFLMVKNASGTFKYKYIYQNGQLVAFENYDGKKFFVLGDHKGSTSVITNESGAKVEETFYEPFGKVISGGAVSRFSYEGKEFSSVLQDYDFHARKYDPDLKVFTQPDTIIQNVYDPQSLNRYAFERNNPVNRIDPDGHVAPLVVAAVMIWQWGDAVGYGMITVGYGYLAIKNLNSEDSAYYKDAFWNSAANFVTSAYPAIASPKGWFSIGGDTKTLINDWKKDASKNIGTKTKDEPTPPSNVGKITADRKDTASGGYKAFIVPNDGGKADKTNNKEPTSSNTGSGSGTGGNSPIQRAPPNYRPYGPVKLS